MALLLAGFLLTGLGRDATAGPIYTVAGGVSISNIATLTDVTNSLTNNTVGNPTP